MEHFFYLAYGLSIRCDFPLPELLPHPALADPDVIFEASASRGGESDVERVTGRIGREVARLEWPGVGRFALESGRRARIEAARDVPDSTLRAYLLGPVLSVLLYQRGFLVLHASTVALRDASGHSSGAVGFLGHSGSGKSTMAAALHARGHRLVADDVAAIPIDTAPRASDSPPQTDGRSDTNSETDSEIVGCLTGDSLSKAEHHPRTDGPLETDSQVPAGRFPLVFSAYPQLRLSPQTVQALGEDASTLPLLMPGEERRVRRAEQGFESAGAVLRALYVLEHGDEVEFRRLTPAQGLMQLVQHTYCTGLPDPLEAAAQFHRCGTLAQTLPVFALKRPKDLTRLGEVAALIETHCETHRARDRSKSSNFG